MGGTSKDVKGQKKVKFVPFILWVFFTIYVFCFDENYLVFKYLLQYNTKIMIGTPNFIYDTKPFKKTPPAPAP